MLNKTMKRKLYLGEAIDLKDCERIEIGNDKTYVIKRSWLMISAYDFCDSSTESWILSIGKRKSDGLILASVTPNLYRNPDFDCLWIR